MEVSLADEKLFVPTDMVALFRGQAASLTSGVADGDRREVIVLAQVERISKDGIQSVKLCRVGKEVCVIRSEGPTSYLPSLSSMRARGADDDKVEEPVPALITPKSVANNERFVLFKPTDSLTDRKSVV